jgi:hypothetical protein
LTNLLIIDLNESNDREESILFKATQDCVLHGFAGYFESTLYGSIIMSILPKSFSHGMFSWFPMFFPLLVSSRNMIFALLYYLIIVGCLIHTRIINLQIGTSERKSWRYYRCAFLEEIEPHFRLVRVGCYVALQVSHSQYKRTI